MAAPSVDCVLRMRRVASSQASQVLTDARIYNPRVRLIYAQRRMLWASRRRIVDYTSACNTLGRPTMTIVQFPPHRTAPAAG